MDNSSLNDIKTKVKATKKVIESGERSVIKTMTYNLQSTSNKAFKPLLKEIKEHNCDIIALLSVRAKDYNIIATFLEDIYLAFQVFIDEGEESGEVILCKRETIKISEDDPPYYFDYPKGINGKIIGTGLIYKKHLLNLVVVKFNSEIETTHIRDRQSDTLAKIISKLDNYILMGDINTSPNYKETTDEILLDQKMQDCWSLMGCPMRIKYTHENEKSRSSRIYFKSKVLNLKAMSLFTFKAIKDTSINTISSNYGLMATFLLRKRA